MADGNDDAPGSNVRRDDDTIMGVRAVAKAVKRWLERRWLPDFESRINTRIDELGNSIVKRVDDADRQHDERLKTVERAVAERMDAAVTRITEVQNVMERPRHTLEELEAIAFEELEKNDPVT